MIAPTPANLGALWRSFGVRAALYRMEHMWRRRRRRFLRAPSHVVPVLDAALPRDWPIRPDLAAIAGATDVDQANERACRVIAGEHFAYGHEWRARPRSREDWHTNPSTGYCYDAEAAWFEIAHHDAMAGDIKDTWEPARFGWVFDLLRGHAIGVGGAAEAFWDGVESFCRSNPPFQGVQWSCGQETAMRALAVLWGEAGFADAPWSTEERRRTLVQLLRWSAERIENAIGYALSQRNNHGISEAVGLVVLGARLRRIDPRADRWYARGRALLERLIDDQFLPDGWYIQHSFNYQRVALAQLVVAQLVLRSRDDSLSPVALTRLRASVELLSTVMQPETGEVPNYGANDGTDVLPLVPGGYRDFRAIVTAAAATFDVPVASDIPLAREALAWLALSAPATKPCAAEPWLRVGTASGWVALRGAGLNVFARAAHYGKSRPSHIDPLHVSVASAEGPIAIDAGTYRYSAPAPWDNALDAARVHNTVLPVDSGIAYKLSRFIWAWSPRLEMEQLNGAPTEVRVRLTHRWHSTPAVHRRTLVLDDSGLLVTDEIRGAERATEIELHWLIASGARAPEVTGPAGPEIVEASRDSVDGWVSWWYGALDPARSLRWRTTLTPDTTSRWTSHFAPARYEQGERRMKIGDTR